MKLRGALLGAGNIALDGHGPQWARDEALQRDVEIVAVADLSPSNLQAALNLFPNATPYARAQDLLDREDLDFGDICTPPFTHRALIEQAAERGLHVLCEKPLAPSLADAQGISEAVS
ncbi:MAG: Gfo/Idh/MocA family protein, partial [Vicinamibacteria bacterium]